MSWQPEVFVLPPSGKRTGVATTLALVGSACGTLTIEIRSCGGLQSADALDGP